MRVIPSTPSFGATVTGFDLISASNDQWRHLEDAFRHFAVLIFPRVHLGEDEHLDFARRWGPLERTLSKRTDRPEVSLLSNVTADDRVAAPDDTLGLYLKGNRAWHTDSSFKKVGAMASILRAVEVPTTGGDTEFADMRAAYDALDATERERLDGLEAVHSYAYSQGLVGGTDLLSGNEWDDLPPVTHPLVRVHADTGRKSLYVGRHISHVVGMSESMGREMVADLVDRACRAPRTFRHHWSVGDIVMWDNRCVLHRGHTWPFEERRVMRRATVAGRGNNPWALDEAINA